MEQSRSTSWFQIIIVYLIGLFGMMVVSAAVPALHGIAAEYRPKSPALIGFIMSTPALAAVLTSLFVGSLSDRFGDRRIMVGGGALVVLADLGVTHSPSIGALLGWRAVAGLGYVGVVVSAVAMIARLTSGRRRTSALALWSTVIPASFIAASLYGATVGQSLGWRMVFYAHAVGITAMIAFGLSILPDIAVDRTRATRLTGIGQVLRTPWPFVLGASFAAAAFLQTGFIAALPAHLIRIIGATEAQVHSFTMLAMACNIAGAFLFGILVNRGWRPAVMGVAAALLCAGAGGALILLPTALGDAVVMNCALMFALGILVGMWALLPAVAPSPAHIGATSGLITQVTLLGVLFGPPAALASFATGQQGALLYLGFGALLSLIAWPVWRRSALTSTNARVGH